MARLPTTQLHSHLTNPPTPDDSGAGYTIWHTSEQQAVLDLASVGAEPSWICELDLGPSAPQRVLLAGANPALVAYAISSDRAFSARDVAKRAANSVISGVKGLLWRGATESTDDDVKQPVKGVVRVSNAWADDGVTAGGLITFGDVTDSAKKSVHAVLARGRRQMDKDAALMEGRKKSFGSGDEREGLVAGMIQRQRSRLAGEEVIQLAKLPQNTRVVERVVGAPSPCSLVATADTLGRVFVQDSRDLCVLRVLKGYRDAQVAWVKEGGPVLAVLAPRLNVLELHWPLGGKRVTAFELESGSMLVQSTDHRVFCVTPDGGVYEVMRARKGTRRIDSEGKTGITKKGSHIEVVGREKEAGDRKSAERHGAWSDGMAVSTDAAADYEAVGGFVEAVKRGQTSTAVEYLQRVENDAVKVAHLMASLVTCAAYIRTEMHVALSAKAAQIVANLGYDDLVSRFEAHGKLAEAFALLAAELMPDSHEAEQERILRHGRLLLDHDVGEGLVEIAVDGRTLARSTSTGTGKRKRTSVEDDKVINCERFILSHAIEPSSDLRAKLDYTICPRRDLSASEHIWLSKVYFSRLLEVDSADIPTEGREHPTTKDVFLALTDFVGLSEEEFARQFVTFFLNSSLLSLLRTHASLYASPLRCTIGRLRNRFMRDVVDRVVLDLCENSTQVPNAVLLMRLFTDHEQRSSKNSTENHFSQSLEKLEELLQYRKFVAGSNVPEQVCERLTARQCTGVPGDAERYAVKSLIDWNEFEKASQILRSLGELRKRKQLHWHESTSVSESALHACRKKAVCLINDGSRKVIPAGVVSWILLTGQSEKQPEWETLLSTRRDAVLRQIRAVLLSAHQYFPDSSVDAVRCLQLAEAMSALIELDMASSTGSSKDGDVTVTDEPTEKTDGNVQTAKKTETKISTDTTADPTEVRNADMDHCDSAPTTGEETPAFPNSDEAALASGINNTENNAEETETVNAQSTATGAVERMDEDSSQPNTAGHSGARPVAASGIPAQLGASSSGAAGSSLVAKPPTSVPIASDVDEVPYLQMDAMEMEVEQRDTGGVLSIDGDNEEFFDASSTLEAEPNDKD